MDAAQVNEQALKRMYEALGRGDLDTLLGSMTDDIEFRVTGRNAVSGDYGGKDGVLEFIGKLVELSGGTFTLEVVDLLVNDRHGVVLTKETASHNGKSLNNRAVHVWEMHEGVARVFRGYNQNTWDEFWGP